MRKDETMLVKKNSDMPENYRYTLFIGDDFKGYYTEKKEAERVGLFIIQWNREARLDIEQLKRGGMYDKRR